VGEVAVAGGVTWERVVVGEAGAWGTSVHTSPAADLVAFCQAQHPRLVGALGYYTGDRDIAEELAQDALLRAVRDWDRVSTFDSPQAWVHRVAINLANSSFRRAAAKRRADRRLGPTHTRHDDPYTPIAVSVRSAVSSLPDKMRVVIVLRYFADMSVRETASTLGVPEGTVKTLTHRGLERLRQAGLHDVELTDD